MGGVNLVAGFRPELWRAVAPDDAPAGLDGLQRDIVGADGFTMPATQHDAVLWLSGSAYDVVFDVARGGDRRARRARVGRRGDLELAVPARPRSDGLHRRDREPDPGRGARRRARPRRPAGRGRDDPAAAEVGARRDRVGVAAGRAAGARDRPDEGGQRRARGQAGGLARREHRSGRLREDLPPEHALRDGHRPRDDVRRLLPRAAAARDDAREHGRAGERHRDALTRYTQPLTGAYYFVPSVSRSFGWGRLARHVDGRAPGQPPSEDPREALRASTEQEPSSGARSSRCSRRSAP